VWSRTFSQRLPAGQGEEAAVANLRKFAADGGTEAVATLKCLLLAL
jgi:hypothetical protein